MALHRCRVAAEKSPSRSWTVSSIVVLVLIVFHWCCSSSATSSHIATSLLQMPFSLIGKTNFERLFNAAFWYKFIYFPLSEPSKYFDEVILDRKSLVSCPKFHSRAKNFLPSSFVLRLAVSGFIAGVPTNASLSHSIEERIGIEV